MTHNYPEYLDSENILLDLYARDYMQSALVRILCHRLEEALDGERGAYVDMERMESEMKDMEIKYEKELDTSVEKIDVLEATISDLKFEIEQLKAELEEATK